MNAKGWQLETVKLLYELGYDNKTDLHDENEEMTAFIKDLNNEILREAVAYLNFIEDCSDDHFLKLKIYLLEMNDYKQI